MPAAKVKPVSTEVAKLCGVVRKGKPPCRRKAGWGTEHPGRGPCRYHFGNAPNVVKRYARQEAVDLARRRLDTLPDIDPLDAAIYNVRVAHGFVTYQQDKLNALKTPTEADERALAEAVRMSQQVNDQAIRAGVADRLAKLGERFAERLTLAFEQAAAVMDLDAKTRAVGVAAYAAALGELEGQPIEAKALPPGKATRRMG